MAMIDDNQPNAGGTSAGGTAPGVAAEGREAVRELAAQAKEQARGLKEQVMGHARDTMGEVREQASTSFDGGKSQVAEHVSGLARVFHATTEQLRQENEPFAEYTDKVAQQVEQVSTYLRDRDAKALLSDAESFARRRPGMFLATAFALGVLGARFLKSSEQRGRDQRALVGAGGTGYGAGGEYSGGEFGAGGYSGGSTTGYGGAAGGTGTGTGGSFQEAYPDVDAGSQV